MTSTTSQNPYNSPTRPPLNPLANHGDLRALADLIVDLVARHKVTGVIIDAPLEPKGSYYLNNPYAGELKLVQAQTPPRRYTVSRLADVQTIVDHFVKKMPDKQIFVYCGRGLVRVILDEEGNRRETIELRVPDSAPYQIVTELVDSSEPMDHKAFLRQLQVDFSGCVNAEALALIRQLRFNGFSTGESTIQTGKENFGRSVNTEVIANGQKIPEFITLSMPVYEDLVDGEGKVFKRDIRCVFDVDLTNQRMRLVPLPDEVVSAKREADEWMFRELEGLGDHEHVLVFCGHDPD